MTGTAPSLIERHVLKDRPGRRTVTFLGTTARSSRGLAIVTGRIRKQTDSARTRRLVERYDAVRRALVAQHQLAWDGPTCPAVLDFDVEAGWIELEAFSGMSLARVPEDARAEACASVARAVAALERNRACALEWPRREWTAAREVELLARLWTASGRCWPDSAGDVVRCLAKDPDPSLVPAHRDLNEEQVLVEADHPLDGRRWVDWDQASLAPPGLDLGNFLAHERLRALRAGDEARALEAPRREGLVEAYREGGGRARRRVVAAWEAIACLRLAALASTAGPDGAVVRNADFVPLPPDQAVAQAWAGVLERAAADLVGRAREA
jgi:hypothetical protein